MKTISKKTTASDVVTAPLLKGELASILEQTDELRKSNTSYQENFETLLEKGAISKRHSIAAKQSRLLLLVSVLKAYLEAKVAGELDGLAELIKARVKVRLVGDGAIIRGLIRCARPGLSATIVTRYAGGIRYGLHCGCTPATLPEVLGKEGIWASAKKFSDLVTQERQLAKITTKPKTDTTAATPNLYDQTEGENDGKPTKPSGKGKIAKGTSEPAPANDDAPVTLTFTLPPELAREHRRLTRSGKRRRLLLQFYSEGGGHDVRNLWRPALEEWRAVSAAARKSAKRAAVKQREPGP